MKTVLYIMLSNIIVGYAAFCFGKGISIARFAHHYARPLRSVHAGMARAINEGHYPEVASALADLRTIDIPATDNESAKNDEDSLVSIGRKLWELGPDP